MNEQAEMAIATLEELKADKLAEIKANQGQIESLEDENSILTGQVKTLEEAIEKVQKLYGNDGANHSRAEPPIGKYATSTLTQAILDVVAVHGSAPGMLVPEIIEKLTRDGFTSRAKKLYASVYAVAHSLAQRGKIREGRRDEKRSFMHK